MNPAYQAGRWLLSRTFRRALDRHRHIGRLLRAQSDRLTAEAKTAVQAKRDELRACWRAGGSKPELRAALTALQASADEHLDDASKSLVREGCEILLVAFVVVLAIKSFFCQTMRIPSGSMQPTLYGVTVTDLREQRGVRIPKGWRALWEHAILGNQYYEVKAASKGALRTVLPPEPIHPLLAGFSWLRKQRFLLGETWYTLWFPPRDAPGISDISSDFAFVAQLGIHSQRVYLPGETIVRARVSAGDYVLINRLAYNFGRPRRGDIVVFATDDVPQLQPGTHYLKRLVGLPGDRLRIANDRYLWVNGQRLNGTEPGFDGVFSFSGRAAESVYSGYLNDFMAQAAGQPAGSLAPLFPRESTEFIVRSGHCLVLGDNTVASYDGRRWGDFLEERLIGRFLFVYWPFTERFGWGQR